MGAGGISQGQIVAVVSAAALVVSLFLAWGGAGGDLPALPEGASELPGAQAPAQAAEDALELTGWESQNTLDIYLAIVAALVLGNALIRFMGNPDGLPFAPPAAGLLLGAIGLILTAYVLIDLPEGADPKIGIFIAIAASAGIAIGSYLQVREELAELY